MKGDSQTPSSASEARESPSFVSPAEELSIKFSDQGTSNSKSSGKKKVVCILYIYIFFFT